MRLILVSIAIIILFGVHSDAGTLDAEDFSPDVHAARADTAVSTRVFVKRPPFTILTDQGTKRMLIIKDAFPIVPDGMTALRLDDENIDDVIRILNNLDPEEIFCPVSEPIICGSLQEAGIKISTI